MSTLNKCINAGFVLLIIIAGIIGVSKTSTFLSLAAIFILFALIFHSFNGSKPKDNKYDNMKLRIIFIITNIVFAIYYLCITFAPEVQSLNTITSMIGSIPNLIITILFALNTMPSLYLIENKTQYKNT